MISGINQGAMLHLLAQRLSPLSSPPMPRTSQRASLGYNMHSSPEVSPLPSPALRKANNTLSNPDFLNSSLESQGSQDAETPESRRRRRLNRQKIARTLDLSDALSEPESGESRRRGRKLGRSESLKENSRSLSPKLKDRVKSRTLRGWLHRRHKDPHSMDDVVISRCMDVALVANDLAVDAEFEVTTQCFPIATCS